MAQQKDVFAEAEELLEDDDLHGDEEDGEEEEGSHESESKEDDEDSRIVIEEEKTEEEQQREAMRTKRRELRKQKQQERRERESRLRADLLARDQLIENLAKRIQTLEYGGARNEVMQIDTAINQLAESYVEARNLLKSATEAQNGEGVVAATERMQQIRVKAEQLAATKNAMIQRAQQQPVQQGIDPRLKNYAENWIKSNSWYTPNGTDEDSRTVKALDDQLAQEGWNPNDPNYWDELTNRVKKRLPERFKSAYNPEGRSKKTIVSGSSRSASAGGTSTFHLSPERVAAMKEAGMWDNPEKRAKMIADYKKYDKENGAE